MWDTKPSDAGILFFPHKQLDTKMSHHWYPMIENYDDDYFKTLGWSERVFIFDRQHMIKILNIYNHKKFIEFICHNQLKTKFVLIHLARISQHSQNSNTANTALFTSK